MSESVAEKQPSTTREEALKVACPSCGAAAGEPCRRDEVPPSHRERHAAAIANGAPKYERGENGKYELRG